MSSHINSGVEISILVKTMQLQTKLPSTASTEIAALKVLDRRVNKVIIVADVSGKSRIIHGSELLVVNFIWTRTVRQTRERTLKIQR